MAALYLAAALGLARAQGGFDATAYGAIPNDGVSDTYALRRAIDAAQAAGGGVVQLPSGTLHIWHLRLAHLQGITLRGQGAYGPEATTLVRIRGKRSPDRERLLTVHTAQDLRVEDLAVDMNRIEAFGGLGLYRCTRCTIARVRVYDGRPAPYVPSPDRYALVFGFGGREHPHEDLVIRDSRFEDLQVEIDHARRVEVLDNVFLRGDFTAALGFFALGPGYLLEDVTVRGNAFRNAARQALTFQLDVRPGEPVGDSVFRRIVVADNVFVSHPVARPGVGLVLRLGMHDNSVAAPGTVFADIRVRHNRLYLAPGVQRSGPLVFGNVSGRSGWLWQGLTIEGNTLYAHTAPRRFVEVRRVAGDAVRVLDNAVRAYETPPALP